MLRCDLLEAPSFASLKSLSGATSLQAALYPITAFHVETGIDAFILVEGCQRRTATLNFQ